MIIWSLDIICRSRTKSWLNTNSKQFSSKYNSKGSQTFGTCVPPNQKLFSSAYPKIRSIPLCNTPKSKIDPKSLLLSCFFIILHTPDWEPLYYSIISLTNSWCESYVYLILCLSVEMWHSYVSLDRGHVSSLLATAGVGALVQNRPLKKKNIILIFSQRVFHTSI